MNGGAEEGQRKEALLSTHHCCQQSGRARRAAGSGQRAGTVMTVFDRSSCAVRNGLWGDGGSGLSGVSDLRFAQTEHWTWDKIFAATFGWDCVGGRRQINSKGQRERRSPRKRRR